jgi:hypothetical protein
LTHLLAIAIAGASYRWGALSWSTGCCACGLPAACTLLAAEGLKILLPAIDDGLDLLSLVRCQRWQSHHRFEFTANTMTLTATTAALACCQPLKLPTSAALTLTWP